MRVEIEREMPTKRWKVWVIQELGADLRVMDAEGEWLIAASGAEPPAPTWVIDDEVWQPLTAAILGLPPESKPLSDALTDTREVRDRLLTLVESAFPALVIAPRGDGR